MKKNNINVNVAIGIVCVLIGFVGGNMYGKNHNLNQNKNGYSMMQNGQQSQFGRSGNMMRGVFGGGTAGEIISKDDKSLTLKLRDGGSKIVLFGNSVAISHSVLGAISDLAVGGQVVVNGTTNTDGSVTASTIQIRPEIKK